MEYITGGSVSGRRRKRKFRKILIFVLIVLFISLTLVPVVYSLIRSGSRVVSPVADDEDVQIINQPTTTPFPIPGKTSPSDTLGEAVSSALNGTSGKYGVVVRNLKTGEYYYRNEHYEFDTASLYKLWVMASVYEQIQNGVLTKDQVLSSDIADLNQKFLIGPENAELTEGTITLSVEEALEKMITISDNYSALLLTAKIRLSTVADFLRKNGFNESQVGTGSGNPTTTAADTALFLEKLYKGELVNPQYSAEMMALLKDQRLNNKLPLYLPDNTVIGHKTGELGSITHDAGIVYTDQGDYIIVVLSDSDNPPAAEDRIARVSFNVYKYFTEK